MTEVEKLKDWLVKKRAEGMQAMKGFMWAGSAKNATLEELAGDLNKVIDALENGQFTEAEEFNDRYDLRFNFKKTKNLKLMNDIREEFIADPEKTIRKYFVVSQPQGLITVRDTVWAHGVLFGLSQQEATTRANIEAKADNPIPFYWSPAQIELLEMVDAILKGREWPTSN